MVDAVPGPALAGTPKKLFFFLTFCVFFLSFRGDVLHLTTAQRAYNLGVDMYVIPAMEAYADGDKLPRLQAALGEIQLRDYDGTLHPYVMQVGLQRMVYTWLSPHSLPGVAKSIPYLRSLIAALLAATFVVFVGVVLEQFGFATALLTAILLALSKWLIVFAPDLFWACATFFIPFVLGFVLGDPARPLKQRRLLAVLFTLACLIKCMCGLDYVTNIFAAIAVPFLYYGLLRGVPLMKIVLRVVGYGLLSLAACAGSFVFLLLQFKFVQKNLRGSIAQFFVDAHKRTFSNGEGMSSKYDETLLSILHKLHVPASYDARLAPHLLHVRPLLRYFRYLGMSAFNLPVPHHPVPVPIGLFVVGFLLLFAFQYKRLARAFTRGIAPTDRKTAWLCSTLVALFVSHLWVVMANGHMTHTFLNAIVFYIPFLPMAYVAIAFGLASVFSKERGKLRDTPQPGAAI